MKKLTLKIKKLVPDAIIPSYAHPGDAGMDLFASATTPVKRGELVRVSTGVAMEIPEGFVGLIWDKSGLATSHGLKMMGGVIDSGYRGEILVGMTNIGPKDYVFEKGHKVAQMLIQKIESPEIKEVKELSDSHRGAKGFGSSGK